MQYAKIGYRPAVVVMCITCKCTRGR